MAARKNIKTNKYGEIELIATKDTVKFIRADKPLVAKVERKVWEDTAGHIWVKFDNAFYMLALHWTGVYQIPWCGSVDRVFGYAI